MRKIILFIAAGITLLACGQKNKNSQITTETMDNELTMVVGTYTSGTSKGIYTFRFDQEKGVVTLLSETEISNPSYLTISDDSRFIYAVSEHGDGRESVSAFSFDKEKGSLQLLNSQQAMGEDPCYIVSNGKNVVTANYSGGSISVFPILQDGSLHAATGILAFTGSGLDKNRQNKPHLHCVLFSPDGKYMFANDLGTDKIYKFKVNPQATAENSETFLTVGNPPEYKLAPGSGPRHLTFSPNAKFAYLINELSGTVTVFEYNDGQLNEIQSIASDTVGARGSADIHVSPDGKFLYASNRLQADGIAIFSINNTNGELTKIGYQLTGAHPRNFIITPNGEYLLVASRDKNAIEVYTRDTATGLLTDTQKDIPVDKPVCLKFAN